ncbi:uncharacterized protein LOC131192465 isoform X2 [Ahaetulla prasina]|uniref:uncharacterized protein LOC131192465 isoform X2 n=1 Tax=Ahaetulla prasina TaxID=499056 RepID=UPI002647F467|nr:uncharacterized protein LOC131192465 isoform X2 [Ahaetulla prasina]
MESFQRDTPRNFALPALLLRKGNGWIFYFLWIFAIIVSNSLACDNQTKDDDCPHRNIFVEEGESVKFPLCASEAAEYLCIWNNIASMWQDGYYFFDKESRPLLSHLRDNFSTEGNKVELKNASHNSSGLYRFLTKSESCMVSVQISVSNERPTTSSSPQSGTFKKRLTKWKDDDCPHRNISVKEGELVKCPLCASEIAEYLCTWNNTTSMWEDWYHFSNKVSRQRLPHFRENVSIGLKNASHNSSQLYRLMSKFGNCMESMQISVSNERPTTNSSSQSGKWSGVMWLPFLAIIFRCL